MPNVDNRVVKMTFDNAEFERRVSQTIASLKRLESATQFKGARRGFSDLDSAAKKVNLKPLADQARDVDGKFKFTGAQRGLADLSLGAKKVTLSPLVDKATEVDRAFQFKGAHAAIGDLGRAAGQVSLSPISEGVEEASGGISRMGSIALTTFGAIGSAAVVAGGIIATKIAGGPIMDGFQEMETNMNSIQTILSNTASKGTTLDQVNDALQQLNEYSDKTIYNFGQMARNIGTFTAAGVDLQTSVNSIKGIANLAAMSGSSSEQASTAMYQLSQALAAGKVSLMDWNSVVNAGMGGEVFKNALFETGKAMGTLAEVPMDQSFTEWEDAGNSFRESLQDEWINEDVLTTTLEAFSGDLNSTQLQLRGFSKSAADDMVAVGAQGQEAATSVKTLTQLMGTVRESIATGWADSFKAVIGGFDESKRLFTGMNDFIGGFISRSADARNKMLLDWKNSGGRLLLLLGFKNVVQTLLAVIDPIRKAFREFFPKRTGEDLIKMTQTFYRFTEAIKPSEKTIRNIGLVFRGFFGVLKVGWVILSETVKFLFDLGRAIFGLIAGPNLSGLGKFGSAIGGLTKSLIDGDKIAGFFDILRGGLERVVGFLAKFRDAVGDLFSKFDFSAADTIESTTGRVQTRFEMLMSAIRTVGRFFASLWKPFLDGMGVVGDALEGVGSAIVDFFQSLGDKVGGALGEGDFDAALDAINTGLLGGLVLLFANFARKGLKLDFDFGGGFFEGIKEGMLPVFEQFTATMKAMTLQIKAEAIMKIAKAVAVLVASLFVLSLMDSDKLRNSLFAVGAGMVVLTGAMFALTKMELNLKKAAEINMMVFAMNGMASALILLAAATAIFGRMDPWELARGLGTIAGMLTAMVIVAKQMEDHNADFVTAAFALGVMAASLLFLSGVIIILGKQDTAQLAKGFIAMAGSLLILVIAMNQLPKKEDATKAGFGMLLLSFAIQKMADAITTIGKLSFEEIAKGLLSISALMNLLVKVVNRVPAGQMLQIGIGFVAISASMILMAEAMKRFGDMSLEEIGRGLLALAGTMLIMAIAVNAMSSASIGAVSLILVAGALLILASVLQVFAAMSFAELGMALLGIAAALTVIAVAASLIVATGAVVAIILLGVALVALGAGMVLVGAGVYLLAEGLMTLSEVGKKGIEGFGQLITSLRKHIPAIVAMVKQFIISMAMGMLEGLPQIIAMISKIGDALLDVLIKLIPKAVKAVSLLIQGIIEHMKIMAPHFIELGFILITNLLKGLDENIEEIVTVAVSVIQKFLGTLAENMPAIVTMGTLLLIKFIEGLVVNSAKIVGAVADLIVAFLGAIAANYHRVILAGLEIIKQFLIGIGQGAVEIVATVTILILQFINALRMGSMLIIAAGVQLILDVLAGIRAAIVFIADAVGDVITEFIDQMALQASRIIWSGIQLVVTLMEGIGEGLGVIMDTAVKVAGRFLDDLADAVEEMGDKIGKFMLRILRIIRTWIDDNGDAIRDEGRKLAGAILNGMTLGLGEKAGGFFSAVGGVVGGAVEKAKSVAKARSPSLVFMELGRNMGEGLAIGMQQSEPKVQLAAGNMSQTVISAMSGAMDILGNTDEFNPTITPVLDLTRVQAEAGKIPGFMESAKLAPKVSTGQARLISSDLIRQNGSVSEAVSPVLHEGPLFQQTINSPKALSQAEIYKQTNNLIKLAKDKLEIP